MSQNDVRIKAAAEAISGCVTVYGKDAELMAKTVLEAADAAPAFEDKVFALYDQWLADDEGNERRAALTKAEATRLVMFGIDLATLGKGILTGDIDGLDTEADR